jgi:uncharacterized membrane protein
MNLFLAIWFAGVGLALFSFPQWFCRKVSPDQMARDRRIMRVGGFVIMLLGLSLLIMHFLR